MTIELKQPPEQAVKNGHDLKWDPGFSGVARWTCSVCHMAAIRYGTNEYGQATAQQCLSQGEGS